MITPAYNLTSTERVLPKLALDFTTGVLDSRVTVTRSLNTATRINSSGLIEVVNANLPRFDFSPTSIGTCRGLLIEEARTNLTQYSQDFTNAWWSKTNLSFGTSGTAPDGTTTANLIIPTNVADLHYLTRNISSTATNTVSWYVKPMGAYTKVGWFEEQNTGNYAGFDLSGAGSIIATSNATATIALASNGFYRITATAASPGGTGFSLFFAPQTYTSGSPAIVWQPNGTDGFLVWGAQFEVGAFATSYIPNLATGTTTRNADVAEMSGTNFSDWFNATEGTFVANAETYYPQGFGNRVFWCRNTATALYNDAIYVDTRRSQSRWQVGIRAGGADQFVQDLLTTASPSTIALAYKANSFVAAINGGGTTTGVSGTIPTVNAMRIGSHTDGTYLNGYMKKLMYFNQRLINAEVTAFSK